MSPTGATAGGAAFTLTVTGTGFIPGAVVHWNGSPLAAAGAGSATQISALVPANLVATAGTVSITVVNPGNVASAAATFVVASTITITAPASLPSAAVHVAYGAVQFSATGGSGGYSWSATGLPPGLTMSNSGVLGGTPAAGSAGDYTVVATVTDAASVRASRSLPLSVTGAVLSAATASGAPVSSLNYSYSLGGSTPATQSFRVASVSPNSGVTFTATPNCSWVKLEGATGTTPGNVTVSVDVTGLAENTYNCQISITSPVATNQPAVTVALAVTSPSVSLVSDALSFSANEGSSTPMAATLAVSGAQGTSFTASAQTGSGSNWLVVTPAAGTTPAVLNFRLDPTSLRAGAHTGTITVVAGGATQTATIRLTISSQPTLGVAPSPVRFRFAQGTAAPETQFISVFTSDRSQPRITCAGDGAAWLGVSCTGPANVVVRVNPAGLTVGTYTAAVTVNATGTNPPHHVVPINVIIDPPPPAAPVLSVTPPSASMSLASGGAAAFTQLQVSNAGGGTLRFNASASMISCGNWLSIATEASSVAGGASAALQVQANPGTLNGQTCSGTVTITADNGQIAKVPVIMTVSRATQNISLPNTGLTFTIAEASTEAVTDVIPILNAGSGAMSWTASASTLSVGDSSWLQVTPVGTANPASLATITINPRQLPAGPGEYHGTVVVHAANAANTPQVVSVTVNVIGASGVVAPVVRPSGLILGAAAGVGGEVAQKVTISNHSGRPLSFSSVRVFDDGTEWFTHTPESGVVNRSAEITIQPNAARMTASEVRTGTLRLLFADGTLREVRLLGHSTQARAATAFAEKRRTADGPQAETCSNKLLVQMTQMENPAIMGRPVTLNMKVTDCNGAPFNRAMVGVFVDNSYTREIPQAKLVGSGLYATTWIPALPANASQATQRFSVKAVPIQGSGVAQGGDIQPPISVRILREASTGARVAAVINTASYVGPGTISPGTWIAIFGENLAEGQEQASTAPLGTTLQGAEVRLSDRPLPVLYAGPGQINVQIPYDVAPNVDHQILVRRGATQANPPQPVVMVQAQPALFTINSQGSGAGVMFVKDRLVGQDNPARSGDVVTIYATGLGFVSPAVPAGTAAPGPAQTLDSVRVVINGVDAVVQYAGLSPGSIGLYQINAVVPDTVPAGDHLVVIHQGGLTSQTGVVLSVAR